MPYLSETLKETGPIDFEFVARTELLTKKKKAGGTYQQYDYTFLTRSDGKIHTEGIFEKTHDIVLAKANRGDLCRAELTPDGKFVKWTILKGTGDSAPPIPGTNSSMVKGERTYSKEQETYDQGEKIKQVMISLAGLTQAYISMGVKDPKEALKYAKEARGMIIEEAISIVTE